MWDNQHHVQIKIYIRFLIKVRILCNLNRVLGCATSHQDDILNV